MTRYTGDAVWFDSLTIRENGEEKELFIIASDTYYLEAMIFHCDPEQWADLPAAASPDEKNAGKRLTVRCEDGAEFILTGEQENSAGILEKADLFMTSYTKDRRTFQISFASTGDEDLMVIPMLSVPDCVTWKKEFRVKSGFREVAYIFDGRIPGEVEMYFGAAEEEPNAGGNDHQVIYTLKVDEDYNVSVSRIRIVSYRLWDW